MFLRTLVGFFERIPFLTASAAFFALLAAFPAGLPLVAVFAAVATLAASGAGAGVFLDGMRTLLLFFSGQWSEPELARPPVVLKLITGVILSSLSMRLEVSGHGEQTTGDRPQH